MRILATLLCLTLAARAAGEESAQLVKLEVDKAMELGAFLDLMSKATAQPILFDPNSQRIRGQKMDATFATSVPKAKLFDTMRAILTFYELTLIPVGPRGYEVYLAVDSRSTNNFVKNKAAFVDHKSLDRVADQDGMYIRNFVPVQHIENLTTLRTALSSMVSPAGIGRVHEVPGAGLIVMDFGPTVASMADVIRRMDVPSSSAQVLASIEIQHVKAQEIAEAVQELYLEILVTPTPTRQRRSVRLPSPTPRITWLKTRNVVLVRATSKQLESIRGLITKLDQSVPQAVALEVVRLQHIQPDYLADILTATMAGPATSDWRMVVLADEHTNSIILNGDRKALSATKDIIKTLDVPKTK
jgi:type II secretory pathway component GspD/PulD (secretin)